MSKHQDDRPPSDDRARLIVALLLVIAYLLLLGLMPWVPAVRDPLVFLGPLVGAVVGYYFGQHQNQRRP
jgi:hypothetical protein